MLTAGRIAALLASGVLAISSANAGSAPVECSGRTACQLSAASGGTPAEFGAAGATALVGGGPGSDATPPPCVEVPLAEQPAPDSPYWRGHSARDGQVVSETCDASTGYRPVVLVPYFVPFGEAVAAAAPPPPSPEVLAQQAIADLYIPMPTISIGPDRSKAAVNLWTWLWVDEAAPVSATVSAGGVSVTATATLTSTTWTLGEPAPTGGPYESGPAVSITCQGTGSAPPPGYDWKAEPPCGHKFTWMSAKARTGGTGTWPITVTTNWAVAWQSNTGVSGADALAGTAADAVQVGEYRIVLVQGPGG